MAIVAKFRQRLYRFLVSLSSPHISSKRLALGFALGTFIAILPTPGFGILLGIFIVFIFKKINKISMLFSFAVWNPLILTPIYLLSYRIGRWLFDPPVDGNIEVGFFSNAIVYLKTYLFGNSLLAIILSIASYFIVLKLSDAYKEKRAKRKLKSI